MQWLAILILSIFLFPSIVQASSLPPSPVYTTVAAWPPAAPADNQTNIIISVDLEDSNLSPTSGHNVTLSLLSGGEGITIDPSTQFIGSSRGLFNIKSSQPGTFTFQATADGITLNQTPSITFTYVAPPTPSISPSPSASPSVSPTPTTNPTPSESPSQTPSTSPSSSPSTNPIINLSCPTYPSPIPTPTIAPIQSNNPTPIYKAIKESPQLSPTTVSLPPVNPQVLGTQIVQQPNLWEQWQQNILGIVKRILGISGQ